MLKTELENSEKKNSEFLEVPLSKKMAGKKI